MDGDRLAVGPGTARPDLVATAPEAIPAVPSPAPIVPGRTGVLGGTFDPIHFGHLALAEEAREALGLERVLFVPAGDPWQKADRAVSDGSHRLAMLELAVAGAPAFEVSRIELDRPGPSYTAETLEVLAAEVPTDGREPDLWFLLSTDALLGLPTWHDPERVLRLARLAVAPRPALRGMTGAPTPDRAWVAERFPGFDDRVTFLDGPWLAISGTVIRARVRAGRSVRYHVPDAVAAYIGDHGLYRNGSRRKEGS